METQFPTNILCRRDDNADLRHETIKSPCAKSSLVGIFDANNFTYGTFVPRLGLLALYGEKTMRQALWHSWSRLSGIVFPASAAALFFTPQDSSWVVMLALAAVASGGTWAYLRGNK